MSDDFGTMPDWVRGDSLRIETLLEDPVTLLPAYLTGCSIVFTVKENITDTDAEAKIKKSLTITDDVNGLALLVLTRDDTDIPAALYYFDFQITEATGDVYTPSIGRWKIIDDVTRIPTN